MPYIHESDSDGRLPLHELEARREAGEPMGAAPRCPECGEPTTFDADGFRVDPCPACGWGTAEDRERWAGDVP